MSEKVLQFFKTKGMLRLLLKVRTPTADFNFQYRTVADAENQKA